MSGWRRHLTLVVMVVEEAAAGFTRDVTRGPEVHVYLRAVTTNITEN